MLFVLAHQSRGAPQINKAAARKKKVRRKKERLPTAPVERETEEWECENIRWRVFCLFFKSCVAFFCLLVFPLKKFFNNIYDVWIHCEPNGDLRRGKDKIKKNTTSTRCSQAVTHPSTNRARRCFGDRTRKGPVLSTWYGRWQHTWNVA